MVKLWQILVLVALTAAVSGCCSVCNFSTGFNTGFDKSTFTLSSYEYEVKEMTLGSDSKLSYTVTANGGSVDIYLLDEANYEDYADNGMDWDTDYYDEANPSVSGTFSPGKAGTYYFVVENLGDEDVQVTWDISW
ncbi:MAG: hypothetical protein A4E28_01301 [Methanocella sp. PtaU1.Bin125]|nr:MAG: hypothetical protein A4E28_01301 [Methanocella sp. PtaU1.Bin125]